MNPPDAISFKYINEQFFSPPAIQKVFALYF